MKEIIYDACERLELDKDVYSCNAVHNANNGLNCAEYMRYRAFLKGYLIKGPDRWPVLFISLNKVQERILMLLLFLEAEKDV